MREDVPAPPRVSPVTPLSAARFEGSPGQRVDVDDDYALLPAIAGPEYCVASCDPIGLEGGQLGEEGEEVTGVAVVEVEDESGRDRSPRGRCWWLSQGG